MAVMSGHARYRACFVASILLFVLPHAGAQDDQLAFRNLFEKARERSDVNAQGMPGFVLRGDVRIFRRTIDLVRLDLNRWPKLARSASSNQRTLRSVGYIVSNSARVT